MSFVSYLHKPSYAWLSRLLCLSLFGCLSQTAYSQSVENLAQTRSKAVTQVVLGILSYTRWPVEPATLSLCIVGPTQYTDDLLKQPIQATGRPVHVERLLGNSAAIATDCNAVYLGEMSTSDYQRLVDSISGRGVLTISEREDACLAGVVFCLKVSDQQVAFEVNLDSVARSGVRVHPSVLKLAKRHGEQP